MIESFEFRNLRSLARVDIPLGPMTVIVGPNGAGKSTVLDGAHALTRAVIVAARQEDLGGIFSGKWHSSRIRTAGSDDSPVQIAAQVATGGGQTSRLALSVGPPHYEVVLTEGERKIEPRKAALRSEGQRVGSALRLRLEASALAEESYSTEEVPRLDYRGYGLATVLSWIAQVDRDQMTELESRLTQIVPRARRIRTQRKAIRLALPQAKTFVLGAEDPGRDVVPGERLEVEMDGAGWVPADLLSEGTLLALAVLTVLQMPTPPRLILLDDIERGLHPRAQREMAMLLRKIASDDGPQIVATTHSPFVLDAIAPEDVRVMHVDGNGHSACRRLVEHPEWKKWKDVMDPGELWSWAGEEWVFGNAK